MCIDIMEIWFGIANGKFHQIFKELSARDTIMAGYYSLTFLFCFCFFYCCFFISFYGLTFHIVKVDVKCHA